MLTLTGVTVESNSSDLGGGGIENHYNGTMAIVNSTISNNRAPEGGGILNYGTLDLRNTFVTNNRASVAGGGIDNARWSSAQPRPRLYVRANTFITGNGSGLTFNTVVSSGGGINNSWGIVVILDSRIYWNNAQTGAGFSTAGTGASVVITDSTLNTNTATRTGGGLFAGGGEVTITNVIATDNQVGLNSGAVGAGGSRLPGIVVTFRNGPGPFRQLVNQVDP
jgi:hypothetical protein